MDINNLSDRGFGKECAERHKQNCFSHLLLVLMLPKTGFDKNVRVSQYGCHQRTGIAVGGEFIVRPARNRC